MKNYVSSRATNVLVSFCAAMLLWMILNLIASLVSEGSSVYRILQIMGGTKDGIVQMFTYAAFLLGIIELIEKERFLNLQYQGFDWHLLPIEENAQLSKDELNIISGRIANMEKHGQTSLLSSFIKRACTQYSNNRSVNDTLQIMDAKINTAKEESEGQLEIVRYLINTISALGFIGTVIGLSVAIGNSGMSKTESGLHTITQYLYLAFDTTLVALLLGLVLSYRYHGYLERLDTFYSKSKSYIVDNLICRIENV
jgi:biopolymer transport protein ExbB/TolQ